VHCPQDDEKQEGNGRQTLQSFLHEESIANSLDLENNYEHARISLLLRRNMDKKRFTWYGILVLTMLFWSSHYTVSKVLLLDYSPITLVLYRIIFAILFLAPLYFSGRKRKKKMNLNRMDFLWLLLASLVGVLASSLFLLWSVKEVGAGLSSILMNTNPFLVALGAIALGMERVSFTKLFGIVIGVLGVVLVLVQGKSFFGLFADVELQGMLYALLAAGGAAFLTLIGKKRLLAKMGGFAYTFFTLVPSGLVLAFFYAVRDPSVFALHSWGALLGLAYMGVVSTALVWVLFAESLRHLEAGVASSFKLLIPAFSVLLAYLFFGETLHWQAYLGMIIIMGGLYLVSMTKDSKEVLV